jgi:putative endonuclease
MATAIRSYSPASTYYIYILASGRNGILYIGVTDDLATRLEQHRSGRGSEIRQKIQRILPRLCREFASPQDAIARESS